MTYSYQFFKDIQNVEEAYCPSLLRICAFKHNIVELMSLDNNKKKILYKGITFIHNLLIDFK